LIVSVTQAVVQDSRAGDATRTRIFYRRTLEVSTLYFERDRKMRNERPFVKFEAEIFVPKRPG
jgi:hypothetical protein